jgi:hypothetical protein
VATAIILPPPASQVRVALLVPPPASQGRVVLPHLPTAQASQGRVVDMMTMTGAATPPESLGRVVDTMMMTGAATSIIPPESPARVVDMMMMTGAATPLGSLERVVPPLLMTVIMEVERVARVDMDPPTPPAKLGRVEGTAVSYGGDPPPLANLVRVVDMMTMMTGAAIPPESLGRVDRRDPSVDITNGSGFRIGMEVANPARVVDMMMTGTPPGSPGRAVDMMMVTGAATAMTGTPLESLARVVDILMIIVGGAGRETSSSLFVF